MLKVLALLSPAWAQPQRAVLLALGRCSAVDLKVLGLGRSTSLPPEFEAARDCASISDRRAVLRAVQQCDVLFVQNDFTFLWSSFAALLEQCAKQAPLVFFDQSDEPGIFIGARALSSLYLNTCRDGVSSANPYEREAPFLAWRHPELESFEPVKPLDVRPVDVCFIGSIRSHPLRAQYYRVLEALAAKYAGKRRFAVMATEPGTSGRLSRSAYQQKLGKAKIAIDLWGNAVVTYRCFESLYFGCAVLAQKPRWRPGKWNPFPDVHLRTFNTPLGLSEILRDHLDGNVPIASIAQRGRAWLVDTFSAMSLAKWFTSILMEARTLGPRASAT